MVRLLRDSVLDGIEELSLRYLLALGIVSRHLVFLAVDGYLHVLQLLHDLLSELIELHSFLALLCLEVVHDVLFKAL